MVDWPPDLPTITDGQVTLRAWRETDADDVHRACQDPDIQRYTQVPVPYLREHAEFFVGPFQRNNWNNRTGIGFAVTGPSGDNLLGACGLIGLDTEAAWTGVGYWIAPWARARGVGTRALRLLSDWALNELLLREVRAEIEDENTASRLVAERAGFVPSDSGPRWEEHRGSPRFFLNFVRTAHD
jgi:RimJ/RimL family protein N-acetyltransferase